MSIEALGWAMKPMGLTPTEQLVLIHLANFANEFNACWPSQNTLAERTGLSGRTIFSTLQSLEGKNMLKRQERRREDGGRSSDILTLLAPGTICEAPPKPLREGGETVATQNLPMNLSEESTTNVVVSEADQIRAAFAEYNMMAFSIGKPKAQKLTDDRRRSIRARLRDCGGLSGWTFALTKLQESPFLMGKTPEEFKVTLDFLLQPKSFTKLMEGAYEERRTKKRVDFAAERDASLAASRESAFAILRGEIQ